MPDYTLYYWPIPFRGQFIRALLAHVHATWEEADTDEIFALMKQSPADQLVPHVGPPVLIDHSNGLALSQTQSILSYLGHKHGLMPDDPARDALTHKIVADANDVLYELTRHNGAQMWTRQTWDDYQPRLRRWMGIFEETGRRYGLTAAAGYALGTDEPGVADITIYALWGTMAAKLPPLRTILEQNAPGIAGLTARIAALPEQSALRAESDAKYGDEWCSGQIEDSLRAVL